MPSYFPGQHQRPERGALDIGTGEEVEEGEEAEEVVAEEEGSSVKFSVK